LFFAVRYRRYFLLLIPFLQYAGFFLMTQDRPPEWNFIVCYAELVMLLVFVGSYRLQDRMSHFLLLYPLASIPSLVMATGNLYQSIFLTVLLCLTAFAYRFYMDNMPWLLSKKFPALIVATWITYGFMVMVHMQWKYGAVLGRHLAAGAFAIQTRSGGLGGSNHAGGIIMFFLPFVKDARILVLATVYLLLTASRGVYFLLPFLWLAMLINSGKFGKLRLQVLKAAVMVGVLLVVAGAYLPEDYKTEVWNFTMNRVFGDASHPTMQTISTRMHDAGREELRQQALKVSQKNYFQGIGLGGFYWGQKEIGAPQEFSNAHNLYLTLLAEGGVLFLSLFLGLLGYMFVLAHRYSREALISLSIFSIYALYSGQLYEASGIVSACDYYYLVFILAYLKFIERSHNGQRRILGRSAAPGRPAI
jgi:hypothetical protein